MSIKWTKKATEALSSLPFIVRNRVRKRVDEEAANRRAE
ncbi:MAG: hypothetical protein JRJ21_01325 [Deltaproteobacteria bacterium]|nr:hypothetical protein [Deltaproteobacteria bacterium]